MKYCIDKYPIGSFTGQKSPGRYIDDYLYKNLENFAEKIVNDMTFMGIIYSSTLEVGTGKSVLATQIGEAWTELVNKKHGLNIKFDINNIVWRPKDLIERALEKDENGKQKMPKYSFILLDEWEDSTYWSELGMTLRQFFRKCRQLNLFILCIIPNWFQLPLAYAVSRSIFAIDVKFNDKLDRGFFSYYNFPAKRMLYVNGKKKHYYGAARPTFHGKFTDGYGVDEIEYRRLKLEDTLNYEAEDPKQINTIMARMLENNPNITVEELSKIFAVSTRTIYRWKNKNVVNLPVDSDNYNNERIQKKEMIISEEELERQEEQRTQQYNEE